MQSFPPDGEVEIMIIQNLRKTKSVANLRNELEKAFYEQVYITFAIRPVLVPDEQNVVLIETKKPEVLEGMNDEDLEYYQTKGPLVWDSSEKGALHWNLQLFYPNLRRIVLIVCMVDRPPANIMYDMQLINLRNFLQPAFDTCDLMVFLRDQRSDHEKDLIEWKRDIAWLDIMNLFAQCSTSSGAIPTWRTDHREVWGDLGGPMLYLSWRTMSEFPA